MHGHSAGGRLLRPVQSGFGGGDAGLTDRAADGLVQPIHVLPGRARLRVAGLHCSGELKSTLERGLPALVGVRRAIASSDTGNVLLHFDPAMPLARAIERIVALLRREIVPPELDHQAGVAAAPPWHARFASDLAADLGTSTTHGLTPAVARERMTKAGENVLPRPVSRSGISILLGQFQTLPVGLLGIAAALSLVTGGLVEFAAIAGVVVLNAAIGYTVESRSERTITSLAAPVGHMTTVVRGGRAVDVPVPTVVPGDLLCLQRGTIIAADARVVAAHELTVSEAMLTGESVPVTKKAEPIIGRAVPLGERMNVVYRGTAVIGGSGLAIVVATGAATEVGRIQRLLAGAAAPETPMQRQLNEVGQQIVWLGLAVCGVLMGVGVLRGFGLWQMLRSSVSLAVAAIPEGLPTVATTTLALGIEDMRRRNVLVRRLDAVETLASVRVFCFDKTGTLTLNRMSVAGIACARRVSVGVDGRLIDADGAIDDPRADPQLMRLLQIGVLCSETAIDQDENGRPNLNGTATENALVQLALDVGLDARELRQCCPRLSIQHRSDAYRFMVTRHRCENGSMLVAVKGSPDDVLRLCSRRLRGAAASELTETDRAEIARDNLALAEGALRVLGFAFKEEDQRGAADFSSAGDLTWVGLAGLADPVRPGTPALMQMLRGAGIHPVVMTGDQVATARAVARQLGLGNGAAVDVLESAEIEGLTPEQLAEVAQRVQVFARVSPADKLAIVRALQGSGVVVAMTGDGINDSPAMKAADVGIAMGWSGAEAAREVADVVLQTDDLMAIAVAIERGRATYTNVRKAVRYLLGTNLSELAVVLAATSAGFGDPLTPIQLLWINMVSDVLPGLGLAFEPPEPGLMTRPPQANGQGILRDRDLRSVTVDGGVIATGALAACGYGVLRFGVSAEARTMTMGSLVIAQLLHALTCRASTRGTRVGPNLPLAGALGISFAAQGAVLLLPGLRRLLGTAPLGPLDLAVTVGAGVLPYLINEGRKPHRPDGRLQRPAVAPVRQSLVAE